MDWRAVLREAQAAPVDTPALAAVVDGVWPGATIGDVEPLSGGLGSVLHRVVLRGAPVGSVVLRQLLRAFGDDADTVRREEEVHRAGAAAGVPFPDVHWSDPDGDVLGRPALLLDFAPGRPIVAALADEPGRAAMAAAVHAVAGVPTDGMAHLPHLHDLDAVVGRFGPPPTTSELVDASALHAAAAAARGAFVAGEELVHMDLHGGNVLWDGEAVTAVLDAPGAAVGNTLYDEAYLWLDTCLAHGREAADALQAAVDGRRPGTPPSAEERHLWRGLALQRGLPTPAPWAEAYRATGVDVGAATVEERFVDLVDEYLEEG